MFPGLERESSGKNVREKEFTEKMAEELNVRMFKKERRAIEEKAKNEKRKKKLNWEKREHIL